MNLRVPALCLLLGSACASPAPAGPEQSSWKDRIGPLQLSWSRKELEAFLDLVRVPGAHRPDFLEGGGFSTEQTPMVFYGLYSLDETHALYVTWNDQDSAKGIRSAEVVGLPDLRSRIAPELFDAVTAIHQSPSAERGLGFSPLRLIRAVNALQPLGKEKALRALWEYYTLAKGLPFVERRKYSLDEYRILPIVQLLFEGPDGTMPQFVLGGGDVSHPGGNVWPLFPIVLVRDVPFMMVSGYMLAGKPQDAADHLRLRLGPIREAPLAPPITPLEAADELTQSDAWTALRLGAGNEGRKRGQIRRQALDAVSSVFSLRSEEKSNDCCVDPTESQWRAAVERASSSGMIWSPEVQDFILGR